MKTRIGPPHIIAHKLRNFCTAHARQLWRGWTGRSARIGSPCSVRIPHDTPAARSASRCRHPGPVPFALSISRPVAGLTYYAGQSLQGSSGGVVAGAAHRAPVVPVVGAGSHRGRRQRVAGRGSLHGGRPYSLSSHGPLARPSAVPCILCIQALAWPYASPQWEGSFW